MFTQDLFMRFYDMGTPQRRYGILDKVKRLFLVEDQFFYPA